MSEEARSATVAARGCEACLWLLALVGLTLPLTAYVGDSVSAFLLASLCALIAIPVVAGVRRRSLSLDEPVFYTVAILALAYPVQVLYAFSIADGPFTLYGYIWQSRDLLRRGLFYCVIGFVTYLGTYYGPAQIMSRFNMPWLHVPRKAPTSRHILAIYGISWSIRAYMMFSGNFATFYNWSGFDAETATPLWTAAQLSWFAYVLAWLAVLESKPPIRAKATLVAICLIESMYFLIVTASKTFLTLLLVYPILTMSLRRKRTAWTLVLGLVLVLFGFIFPFVASQRVLQSEVHPDASTLDDLAGIALEAATYALEAGQGGAQSSIPFSESILSRWHGIDSLSVAMITVPDQIDFIYFRDLFLLPMAVIPRAIAPWKPTSTLGTLFSERIYGGGGGISPFAIAEGYINGGVVGIVLLMAALAFMQRWFYLGFYLPRSGQTLASAIYLYLFFAITNMDSSLLLGWIGFLQSAVIVSCVVFVVCPR